MYKDNKFHRKSIRVKGFDYTTPVSYFVTICSFNGMRLFGAISNEEVELTSIGGIVKDEWLKTASVRRNVKLDMFVVMPNHFHGIVFIEDQSRGMACRAHTEERFGQPVVNSVPTVVRAFKSSVTKRVRETLKSPDYIVWQRNYYEHIIRNDKDLNRIRQYILDNPVKWHLDRENPERQVEEKEVQEPWMA